MAAPVLTGRVDRVVGSIEADLAAVAEADHEAAAPAAADLLVAVREAVLS
jgi:hypothetical protein